MKQIVPNLWFDHGAEEATRFYAGIFKDSKIVKTTHYSDSSAAVSGMPKGSVMTVEFELCGQAFVALNGGPYFKFSPAIALTVYCETEAEIDAIWGKLVQGGKTLMPLDQYPFSKKFGFLEDKYGVSWQLNLVGQEQRIVPALLFVGEMFGKAEEAMRFYSSLFKNAKVNIVERYGKGEAAPEGALKFGQFSLNGNDFIAMDVAGEHAFKFTGAISFMIECENQSEVDAFWSQLTKEGQEQPCGWLADKYGVHWQVVPTTLNRMVADPDPVKAERAMKAMLTMKKIDIQKIQQAYEGRVR